MEFIIKSGNPEKQRTGCLVVGITEPRRLTPAAAEIDQAADRHISRILRKGDISGKPGQSLLLHNVPGTLADRVLLIGCGKERDLDDRQYRTIIGNAMNQLGQTGSIEAVSYLTELNVKGRDYYWKVRQAVEVAAAQAYEFREFKSKPAKDRKHLRRFTQMVASRRDLPLGMQAVADGKAIANGIRLTRDLANRPANICTPSYLAAQAQHLAKTHPAIKVTVLEEDALKKLKMHSLLSVAQGSAQPPRLITLEYRRGERNGRPVALVGKGITFDTGGISLKPAANMDEMKYDMCGAASVLGVFAAAAEMKLPINLVGVIPATENMPGSKATRPGDIYTSMSGQTIEVLNTDAEGRLILCDALTYSERYNPEVVIDIATLTGACVIALGKYASGLLANHNPLAKDLLSAGETSGDRAWQLPLWEEYQKALDSPFADMANVGGRDAGTITAACFLSRFAKKLHWAHLDIAGTAWISGDKKGATGRPVALLTQYLLDRCRKD
ncbi:MAG: leucyl aminopeptidase [Gammaproteobacteria bacterium]|nr:MAG: leucyl aminopeptidase [Gammaproteobacteria bacterium]